MRFFFHRFFSSEVFFFFHGFFLSFSKGIFTWVSFFFYFSKVFFFFSQVVLFFVLSCKKLFFFACGFDFFLQEVLFKFFGSFFFLQMVLFLFFCKVVLCFEMFFLLCNFFLQRLVFVCTAICFCNFFCKVFFFFAWGFILFCFVFDIFSRSFVFVVLQVFFRQGSSFVFRKFFFICSFFAKCSHSSDRLCGSTNNVSCVCAWATHSLPSRAPVYCGCPAGTHRCVTMSRVTS